MLKDLFNLNFFGKNYINKSWSAGTNNFLTAPFFHQVKINILNPINQQQQLFQVDLKYVIPKSNTSKL